MTFHVIDNNVVAHYVKNMEGSAFGKDAHLRTHLKKSGAEIFVESNARSTSAKLVLQNKVKKIIGITLEGVRTKDNTMAIKKNKAFKKFEKKHSGIAKQISSLFEVILKHADVLIGLQKAKHMS